MGRPTCGRPRLVPTALLAAAWPGVRRALELLPEHARPPSPSARAPGPRPDDSPEEDPAGAGLGVGLDRLHGQLRVRERLRVAIQAARSRGEPLGHQLLTGPPGLGKTELAGAIAAELGSPLVRQTAASVRTPDALLRTLTNLEPEALLFLDEVHGLPARATEILYEALDRGAVSVRVRDGAEQRALRVRLPRFTFVGATTDEDQLPEALRSRLTCERLGFYAPEELEAILTDAAAGHGLELAPAARAVLARASRDTPRRALELLRAVRDEANVAGVGAVDLAAVQRALKRLGVDAEGLTPMDRAYLEELRAARRPLGLRALAARLGASEAVVKRVYEAFLLRRGLIRTTPRGRMAARHAPSDGSSEAAA